MGGKSRQFAVRKPLKRRDRTTGGVRHVASTKFPVPPPHSMTQLMLAQRRTCDSQDVWGIKSSEQFAWPRRRAPPCPPAALLDAMETENTSERESGAPDRSTAGTPQRSCSGDATTPTSTETSSCSESSLPLSSSLPSSSSSSSASTSSAPEPTFPLMDLPPELREMVWRAALPGPRTVVVLVYAFPGLKLAPLDAGALALPLARACAEARAAVRAAGYVLAFRDDDDPRDPGVWFNPDVDVLERTLWGRGEDWAAGT